MPAQLDAYRTSRGLSSTFVISANLYGPNCKFDTAHRHVILFLIRKFFEASKAGVPVSVSGDGSAHRDFRYSSEVASALLTVPVKTEGPINMVSGHVHIIREIVETLSAIAGYAKVVWGASKPNGQDYRAYDRSRLRAAGFSPNYAIRLSLEETRNWYCLNQGNVRL